MMKIHHLNCGTCCPLGGALYDGRSGGVYGRLVCHCMLIESDAGLILIDTGIGTRDIADPERRLSSFLIRVNNFQLRPEETAIAQVRALGFDPADVRHIIISHLDFDHAGGIEDFPNAAVHLLAEEKHSAELRKGNSLVGRKRYRPRQWDEVTDWRLYPMAQGERWHGFDAVRQLEGLPPEILLIPLVGHTWGHAGVAIRQAGGRWLFYVADAYFNDGELAPDYRCPPAMRGYQTLMEVDRAQRLGNQSRIRALAAEQEDNVTIFCAHDAAEFDRLSGRAAALSLGAHRAG
jgi:glyoxylase-like metal-dependent hydrolase (beta-lactamase superfamily II)